MNKNVGNVDKSLRIVIGVLLIIGALLGYGWWMWIGVVPLATGLMGNCMLYRVLGINTASSDK